MKVSFALSLPVASLVFVCYCIGAGLSFSSSRTYQHNILHISVIVFYYTTLGPLLKDTLN